MQNAPAFTSLQLVATPLELNHEVESTQSHVAAATNALTAVQSNAWNSGVFLFLMCFLLIQIVPISEDNCMIIRIVTSVIVIFQIAMGEMLTWQMK